MTKKNRILKSTVTCVITWQSMQSTSLEKKYYVNSYIIIHYIISIIFIAAVVGVGILHK